MTAFTVETEGFRVGTVNRQKIRTESQLTSETVPRGTSKDLTAYIPDSKYQLNCLETELAQIYS